MEYVPLVFGTAGVTFLLTHSLIFERPRLWAARHSVFLRTLLSCPFCTGVWVAGLLCLLKALAEAYPQSARIFNAPIEIFGLAFAAMILFELLDHISPPTKEDDGARPD